MGREVMRYAIKTRDGEKGPYTRARLARAVSEGALSRTTLARRTDQESWRTVDDVLRSARRRRGTSSDEDAPVYADPGGAPDEDREADELDDLAPPPEAEGSFALGVLIGSLGGCIIVLLLLRRARPKTREGIWVGLVVQVVLVAVVAILSR